VHQDHRSGGQRVFVLADLPLLMSGDSGQRDQAAATAIRVEYGAGDVAESGISDPVAGGVDLGHGYRGAAGVGQGAVQALDQHGG
jgi:hypothetical protein